MRLRKWLVLLLAIVVLAVGCTNITQETVSGSGKTETRDFSLSGFSGIQAATAFVVQANQADSYKVQIIADDNL